MNARTRDDARVGTAWTDRARLRPGPLPDRAASLLPGLLAATRTGLTPAGNDELMLGSGHPINPLRIAGHTSRFPQITTLGISDRAAGHRRAPCHRSLGGAVKA